MAEGKRKLIGPVGWMSIGAGGMLALLSLSKPAEAQPSVPRLTLLDVRWVKESREREELNGACVPVLWRGEAQGHCGTTQPTKTKEEVLRDRKEGR